MRQPNRLVKGAVLASSVLLVGAFVAYRANAFHWLSETGAVELDRAVMNGGDSAAQVFAGPPVAASNPDSWIIPSSKFGSVFLSPTPAGTGLDGNPFNAPRSPFEEAAALPPPIYGLMFDGPLGVPDGAYLSSPKSGLIFVPPPPAASGSSSTIMYTSKDGLVFPPPAQIHVAPAGSIIGGSKSDRVFLPRTSSTGANRGTTVMPSSKSGAVFPPPVNSPTAPATTMSSSKSIILAPPAASAVGQPQQARKRPAPNTSQAAARSR